MKNLDGLSVYEAQDKIREYLKPLFVSKPREPKLKNLNPTEEEVASFLEEKNKYQKELKDYNVKNDFYREESSRLYGLLEEMVKEDSGLNDIPEQYRSKVYSYAWERGHSSGYGEVYNYLCNLVAIFD